MRRILRNSALALLALACAGLAAGQNVFVLPGSGSSPTVTVVGANPFTSNGTFSGGAAAVAVLPGPNGTFYIVANTTSNCVTAVNSSFSTVTPVASCGVGATQAIETPDGKRLVVVMGQFVQVIDTTTNNVLAFNTNIGGQIADIAASIDSSRVFVLANTSTGWQVVTVDMRSGSVTTSVNVPVNATAISVAPTGLVYVSAPNAIIELDPSTLATLHTIAVTGQPGKLYFTPDGTTGVAPNLTPSTGPVLFVVNMGSRTASGSLAGSSLPSGTILTTIFPVGNNRVFAYSPSTQGLFDITLNPLTATQFPFSLPGTGATLAISTWIATATVGGEIGRA